MLHLLAPWLGASLDDFLYRSYLATVLVWICQMGCQWVRFPIDGAPWHVLVISFEWMFCAQWNAAQIVIAAFRSLSSKYWCQLVLKTHPETSSRWFSIQPPCVFDPLTAKHMSRRSTIPYGVQLPSPALTMWHSDIHCQSRFKFTASQLSTARRSRPH